MAAVVAASPTVKAFYINGIFTDEEKAKNTAQKIQKIVGPNTEPVHNNSLESLAAPLKRLVEKRKLSPLSPLSFAFPAYFSEIKEEKEAVKENLKERINSALTAGTAHIAIFAHSQGADIVQSFIEDWIENKTFTQNPTISIVTLGPKSLVDAKGNPNISVVNANCFGDPTQIAQLFSSGTSEKANDCLGHSIESYLNSETIKKKLAQAVTAPKDTVIDLDILVSESDEEVSTLLKLPSTSAQPSPTPPLHPSSTGHSVGGMLSLDTTLLPSIDENVSTLSGSTFSQTSTSTQPSPTPPLHPSSTEHSVGGVILSIYNQTPTLSKILSSPVSPVDYKHKYEKYKQKYLELKKSKATSSHSLSSTSDDES